MILRRGIKSLVYFHILVHVVLSMAECSSYVSTCKINELFVNVMRQTHIYQYFESSFTLQHSHKCFFSSKEIKHCSLRNNFLIVKVL